MVTKQTVGFWMVAAALSLGSVHVLYAQDADTFECQGTDGSWGTCSTSDNDCPTGWVMESLEYSGEDAIVNEVCYEYFLDTPDAGATTAPTPTAPSTTTTTAPTSTTPSTTTTTTTTQPVSPSPYPSPM